MAMLQQRRPRATQLSEALLIRHYPPRRTAVHMPASSSLLPQQLPPPSISHTSSSNSALWPNSCLPSPPYISSLPQPHLFDPDGMSPTRSPAACHSRSRTTRASSPTGSAHTRALRTYSIASSRTSRHGPAIMAPCSSISSPRLTRREARASFSA